MGLFRKQGGGGFLAGVTGAITGYSFDTKEWTSDNPKAKKKVYHTLSMGLTIRPDGAEEDVQQFLPAGFWYPEDQALSEDGRTLLTLEDGEAVDLALPVIAEDSEAGKFLASLIESGKDKGLDESAFPDNGSNFEAMLGWRVQFGKALDTDRQMAAGRKALGVKARTATDTEILEAGKQQDKKDKSKSYNRTYLVVTDVFGQAALPKAKGNGKGAVKNAAKASAAKATKSKPKTDDGEQQAVDILMAILNDAKDNTVLKSQLSGKVVAYCFDNDIDDATREQLRKAIYSDEFLEQQQGWVFDKKDRKQPVSLAG